MSSLEMISRLCDLTNALAEIVKKQQTVIERSKINEEVKEELMRAFVESLKKLYIEGRLTIEQVAERVTKGNISADEYEYITGEVYEE